MFSMVPSRQKLKGVSNENGTLLFPVHREQFGK